MSQPEGIDAIAWEINNLNYIDLRDMAHSIREQLVEKTGSEQLVHELTDELMSELIAWWAFGRMDDFENAQEENEN